MKKILFQKFIKDTLKLFVTIAFVIGLIVWVIQAVNFLDFVTEDGHSLYVYFSYSALNFPKMIHRILPFVFFISIFYQILKYESKNELLIFWTNGVKKIQFINVVIFYSILVTIFQIFLGGFISPYSQNEARTYIRTSNVDFFPALIKEGKFIDTVADLTIFIESKDKLGNYKNIFLKDMFVEKNLNEGQKEDNFQIIYAKKGRLVNSDNDRYFELYDGEMINKENNKITNLTFDKINFNLSKYTSKSTTYPKIQEVPSKDIIKCLYLNFKDKIAEFDESKFLQCKNESMNAIKQEFLKRFYKPIYLPLLSLISCLLILKSKENDNFDKFKIFLFSIIFFTIVLSEISLRFATSGQVGMFFFLVFPILTFMTLYLSLITRIKL
jgi:lipopolysaccharide export system permease protein